MFVIDVVQVALEIKVIKGMLWRTNAIQYIYIYICTKNVTKMKEEIWLDDRAGEDESLLFAN